MLADDALKLNEKLLRAAERIAAFLTLLGKRRSHAEAEHRVDVLRSQHRELKAFRRGKAKCYLPSSRVDVLRKLERELDSTLAVFDKHANSSCKNRDLLNLASDAKEQGFVELRKDKIDEYFDLSGLLPTWNTVSPHTIILLGPALDGHFQISQPEVELYRAMCHFHNEAVRTHDRIKDGQAKLAAGMDLAAEPFMDLTAIHYTMCRETIINAFLVVEAFLNAQAELFVANNTLNTAQQLSLQDEMKIVTPKDPNQAPYRALLKWDEKVVEWVSLMSGGKTWEKGREPYQTFRKVKKQRDAIVHLRGSKAPSFREVDLAAARKAADSANGMIRRIAEMTASVESQKRPPFWLVSRAKDGLLHFSSKIEIPLSPEASTG